MEIAVDVEGIATVGGDICILELFFLIWPPFILSDDVTPIDAILL